MRLAIIGSRTFSDYQLLYRSINNHYGVWDTQIRQVQWKIDSIISGGAIGADKLGARFAKDNLISLTEILPDWKTHGCSAGFKRNADIITACDEVICFWDGVSKGSADSLRIAKAQKKPTVIVYF